jgi:hypothetical protein
LDGALLAAAACSPVERVAFGSLASTAAAERFAIVKYGKKSYIQNT